MTQLVLAGGGHAHLLVLEHLAKHRHDGLEVVLLTPSPWQYYSGMLPGWVAGRYAMDDCRIDLRPLADAAGAKLMLEPVAAMNADKSQVGFADGCQLAYDLLSLDVGSETNSAWLAGFGRRLLTVKPLDAFQTAWADLMDSDRAEYDARIVVVGGGAAGVELALAMRSALNRAARRTAITLVEGQSGLLSGHNRGVRKRAARALDRASIDVRPGRAKGVEAGVRLATGETLEADAMVAATGARAPDWLGSSGLALDGRGFVAVDPYQRSLSHANVFAAGDVSSRADNNLPKSGVHAVRAGPVLAHNLLATWQNGALTPYRPKAASLYLMVSGNGRAIASWGRWSAEGSWIWRWKDLIDRRFVRRFAIRAA